jgi:hypothetical protein
MTLGMEARYADVNGVHTYYEASGSATEASSACWWRCSAPISSESW